MTSSRGAAKTKGKGSIVPTAGPVTKMADYMSRSARVIGPSSHRPGRGSVGLSGKVAIAGWKEWADKPRFYDIFSFAVGGISHEADAKFSSTKEGAPIDKLSLKDLGMDDDTAVISLRLATSPSSTTTTTAR